MWRIFCRYFHTTFSNNPWFISLFDISFFSESELDTIRAIYGAVNEMEGIIWTQKPSYKMGWSLDATDRVKCWTGFLELWCLDLGWELRLVQTTQPQTSQIALLITAFSIQAKLTDFFIIFLWGIFRHTDLLSLGMTQSKQIFCS